MVTGTILHPKERSLESDFRSNFHFPYISISTGNISPPFTSYWEWECEYVALEVRCGFAETFDDHRFGMSLSPTQTFGQEAQNPVEAEHCGEPRLSFEREETGGPYR